MAIARKSLALGSMVVLAIANLNAQAAPKIVLKPAVAKLDEEFTQITSVRELSDGRVLMTDGKENRVVVADFKAGSVVQIGRNGQGPGEYATVGILRPLAGDSTLMVEPRAGRWHLFVGATLVATLPPDAPVVAALRQLAGGADARGNVFRAMATPPAMGRGGPGNLPESAFVVRASRATARLDTLGTVKLPKSVMSTTTDAKGAITSVSIVRPPFAVGDEVALFPDGWFAIARVEPYQVDWISPTGTVTNGAALPWPVMRITDREKAAYFAARARTTGRGANGQLSAAEQKQFDETSRLFPPAYPPIVPGGLIPAADGRVIVRHPETADAPNARYDIVDRRGRLVGTIELAKGESLLAVTRASAYVSWKDDDDIERIRKHPWP